MRKKRTSGKLEPGKSLSYNDIKSLGNYFLRGYYFRFLLNLLKNYKGQISDEDIFDGCEGIIPESDMDVLIKYCVSKKVREDLEKQRRRFGHVNLEEDRSREVLKCLWNHPVSRYKMKSKFCEILERYIKELNDIVAANNEYEDIYKIRFKELRELFNLSDEEFSVLVFIFLIRSGFLNSRELSNNDSARIKLFSALLNMPEMRILELAKADAKLRRFTCIDEDLTFDKQLESFINGFDDKPLSSRFFSEIKDSALPWKFYGKTVDEHGEILINLLNSHPDAMDINILLYGEPGTGKTSFATSLAKECGLKAYNISQNSLRNDFRDRSSSDYSTNFRFAAIQVCDNQIEHNSSLIVIDEADELLKSQYRNLFSFAPAVSSTGDKGMLNSILDSLKTPCIWITNTSADELDPSSRRRFDYSIKFEKLNHSQRVKIWKNSIERHGLKKKIPESLIEKLAEKYHVSPGGINLVLQNLSRIDKSNRKQTKKTEQLIDALMKPHCQLLDIQTKDKKMLTSGDYSLEGLNVNGKIKPENIKSAISQFRKHIEKHQTFSSDSPRMNILLSGPPGTGKTEFVKYLGSETHSQIHVKMGSDLLDMYLGGTEQRIKAAFREAEAENAILFIDEVDGMLRSRQMAQRSWEVTQVNELLYQMENFKGVLICATNFLKNLDPATIRRFTFKMEFDYLDCKGKEIFYSKMLGKLNKHPLTKNDITRLHSIQPLTPGDFRNVRQGYFYLEQANIPHAEIMDALQLECQMKQEQKSGTIGFGKF